MLQPTGSWRSLKGMSHSVKEFGESIRTMHILFRETACLSFHDVGKQGKHWPRCTSPPLEPSLAILILTSSVPQNQVGKTVSWEGRKRVWTSGLVALRKACKGRGNPVIPLRAWQHPPPVLLDIRPLSSRQWPELEMISPVEGLQHVGDTLAAKETVLLMVKCFPWKF